jgi:ribosome-binding factor A
MTGTGAERARRLGERIHEVIASLLESRVKDPRLGFVTVTDVRVTGDLREATVFYTVLGDDTNEASTAAALDSARGMLRSELSRTLGIRYTPSLTFVRDALPTNASHITELLTQAHLADERAHQQARAAKFAGAADPYRRHGDETTSEPPNTAA